MLYTGVNLNPAAFFYKTTANFFEDESCPETLNKQSTFRNSSVEMNILRIELFGKQKRFLFQLQVKLFCILEAVKIVFHSWSSQNCFAFSEQSIVFHSWSSQSCFAFLEQHFVCEQEAFWGFQLQHSSKKKTTKWTKQPTLVSTYSENSTTRSKRVRAKKVFCLDNCFLWNICCILFGEQEAFWAFQLQRSSKNTTKWEK